MEQRKTASVFLSRALLLVLVAVMALTAISCGGQQVTEGKKTFTLEVTPLEGETAVFTITSERDMVGDALLDEGLIEGEKGPYGLYVKKVNGITADYDVDGTYWSFYINGEYAMTGVDTTPIEDGAVYALKVAK